MRTGDATAALTVSLTIAGSATNGTDCASIAPTVDFPAGVTSIAVPVSPRNDALAEGDEIVTLALLAGAGYTIGTDASASVTIHDLPFDAWRFLHFSPAELLNAAVGGTLGDAESDESTNLLEYAFDSHPKNGSLSDMPVSGTVTHPGTGERHLALTYLRRKNDPELVYAVQTGSNLTGWSDAGIADIEEISLVDNHDGTETVTVRDRTPLSATSRRYFQIEVRRAE